MTAMLRTTLILATVLAAAAASAAVARADGLPVLGIDVGPQGVASQAATVRYVTLPAGRGTLVARVDQNGGRVQASTLLAGTFTIPAVAYDGSAGGLSADGRTLILIQPRASFPRASTSFAALDTKWLRLRKQITLRGDFSFDAVSPPGSWIYLIHYLSPTDPTRYEVRALDERSGRLAREPVVDPRERDEAMRGAPVTRAMSADGRWAYTLYDGGGKTPFVHALDTRGRTARCIDLDLLPAGADLANTRLELKPGSLSVVRGGVAVADVDLASFRVARPAASATRGGDGDGFPFVPAAAGVLALLVTTAIFGVALRRGRRAPVPTA